jgi:hypothetical protein
MEKIGAFYDHLYILGPFVYLRPFGNLVSIWYIFPYFGILCQEKSGNPRNRAKASS